MRRPTTWSSFAAVVLLLNFGYVLAQTDPPEDDPYNIKRFNNLRLNDPENLCKYLTCQPPMKTCPEGTIWRENVAVYGCCGGCVRFITDIDQTVCTGSMDGYVPEDPTLMSTSFKASLRTTTTDDGNNIIESSWCGYGLECQYDYGNYYCKTSSGDSGSRTCIQAYNLLVAFMESADYNEFRDDYLYLPDCTLEGMYKPKQCKGPIDEERCICVDPNGNPIYGSAFPFQTELYNTMNCECALQAWKQQNEEGIESPTLHCLENGNYEPLQCEMGYCYCIDPNTTVTYGPTVPEKAMFILPCYNTTLLGDNNKYLRVCESKSHAHSTLGTFMREKGINNVPISSLNCDPDGSYSGLQCDSTCNCVDKEGKIYQNSVTEEYGCNCARDTVLMTDYGQTFKPLCRGNSGGYYDYRSDANGAYCVDKQGIRASPKVKEKYCGLLACNSAATCQKDGQAEDDSYKNCNMACSYNGEPCGSCAYVSYQGTDTEICDDYVINDNDNVKCTDPNYGNA